MSTRISSAVGVALILAACSAGSQAPAGSGNSEFDNALAQASSDADDDGRIVCAPAGNAAFARQCSLDRTQSAEGLVLTIHKPDGGFRRLLVVKDGRGVVAADGAEAAKVAIVENDQIEVAIGGDRFRLPATIKGKAAKAAK
ncbi:MAG: hypothetical protein ACTHJR_09465 [Sphingomonas sp.]|uniref:hypothetical protein n=1 Tax=Sphingomonas sp. TaxID=28214 RepID=UPI003F7F661A